jgi:hypothetical protein
VFGRDRTARTVERGVNRRHHGPPVIDAGEIDGYALELGHSRHAFLDRDGPVIGDRDQGGRFRTGLVDVASLRYPLRE